MLLIAGRTSTLPKRDLAPKSREPKRRRCAVCEGRIGEDERCVSCGTKAAATEVDLPGKAEPGSLGPYNDIKYYDQRGRKSFDR